MRQDEILGSILLDAVVDSHGTWDTRHNMYTFGMQSWTSCLTVSLNNEDTNT